MGRNRYYSAHISCWLVPQVSQTHAHRHTHKQTNKQIDSHSLNRLLLLLHYRGSLIFHFAIVAAAAAATFFLSFILQFQ